MKETIKVAKDFAKVLRGKKRAIVLLNGEMGVGKTTFVCNVVRLLKEDVKPSSPTFSIINQYAGNLFHVDLYRVDDICELENTDFFEIIYGDNIVFIEWAEKLGKGFAEKLSGVVCINIKVKEGGGRVYDITN